MTTTCLVDEQLRLLMKTIVIDYGMGNLGSVRRALEECGASVILSSDPASLTGAERIVLPGVGAFAEGVKNLKAGSWPGEIRKALDNPRVALIGICLGMQLLADEGRESGQSKGLGLIPGVVERMHAGEGERIPHIGWNELRLLRASPLLHGIDDRTDFYFVHGYQFNVAEDADVLGMTPYGGGFTAAVQRGNIFGTQFHPEKSSRAGFQILKNFLSRSLLDA